MSIAYFLGGLLLGIGLTLPIWYKVGKLYHECVELEEELDRKGIKYRGGIRSTSGICL